jgi:hypothetical protein
MMHPFGGRVHHHPHKESKKRTVLHCCLTLIQKVPKRGKRPQRHGRFSFFLSLSLFCVLAEACRRTRWKWRETRWPSRAINGLSFGQLADKTPGQRLSIGKGKKKKKPVEVR